MALTPGYFPANYFPHDYWQLGNQYWPTYGLVAAVSHRPRPVHPVSQIVDDETLRLLQQWLSLRVNR